MDPSFIQALLSLSDTAGTTIRQVGNGIFMNGSGDTIRKNGSAWVRSSWNKPSVSFTNNGSGSRSSLGGGLMPTPTGFRGTNNVNYTFQNRVLSSSPTQYLFRQPGPIPSFRSSLSPVV